MNFVATVFPVSKKIIARSPQAGVRVNAIAAAEAWRMRRAGLADCMVVRNQNRLVIYEIGDLPAGNCLQCLDSAACNG